MPRFALHLAYIGTAYHGWQRQKDKSTVQETVEKALYTICQEQITVHASGRTDAGVHALDQVIHCDLPVDKQGISWTRALNAILPPDICVTRHAEVPPEFHARKSAVSKEYSYTFWTEPEYVLPHKRPYVWETGPLDLMQMQQALAGLRGRHDFAALMNTGTPVGSTVRTVSRAELKCGNGPEIVFTVRANGFLKQMVRNMSGLLFAVGKGKLSSEMIPALLSGRDRQTAPLTAPAKGLCLGKVSYDPEEYTRTE